MKRPSSRFRLPLFGLMLAASCFLVLAGIAGTFHFDDRATGLFAVNVEQIPEPLARWVGSKPKIPAQLATRKALPAGELIAAPFQLNHDEAVESRELSAIHGLQTQIAQLSAQVGSLEAASRQAMGDIDNLTLRERLAANGEQLHLLAASLEELRLTGRHCATNETADAAHKPPLGAAAFENTPLLPLFTRETPAAAIAYEQRYRVLHLSRERLVATLSGLPGALYPGQYRCERHPAGGLTLIARESASGHENIAEAIAKYDIGQIAIRFRCAAAAFQLDVARPQPKEILSLSGLIHRKIPLKLGAEPHAGLWGPLEAATVSNTAADIANTLVSFDQVKFFRLAAVDLNEDQAGTLIVHHRLSAYDPSCQAPALGENRDSRLALKFRLQKDGRFLLALATRANSPAVSTAVQAVVPVEPGHSILLSGFRAAAKRPAETTTRVSRFPSLPPTVPQATDDIPYQLVVVLTPELVEAEPSKSLLSPVSRAQSAPLASPESMELTIGTKQVELAAEALGRGDIPAAWRMLAAAEQRVGFSPEVMEIRQLLRRAIGGARQMGTDPFPDIPEPPSPPLDLHPTAEGERPQRS